MKQNILGYKTLQKWFIEWELELECWEWFLWRRRNVDCESKSDDEVEESSPTPSTTTSSSEEVDNDDDDKKKSKKGEKDPQTLEEVLAAIKEAGNLYQVPDVHTNTSEVGLEQMTQEFFDLLSQFLILFGKG